MEQEKVWVLIIAILLACVVFTICAIKSAESNYYALTAIIINVDYENDMVCAQDYNGNVWTFEGAADWMKDDCVSMVINDRGTDKIFDDRVVSVRYNSWNLSR